MTSVCSLFSWSIRIILQLCTVLGNGKLLTLISANKSWWSTSAYFKSRVKRIKAIDKFKCSKTRAWSQLWTETTANQQWAKDHLACLQISPNQQLMKWWETNNKLWMTTSKSIKITCRHPNQNKVKIISNKKMFKILMIKRLRRCRRNRKRFRHRLQIL